jgi:hypothetical protein
LIVYKLHCDGIGCLKFVDAKLGMGIPMPMGWSEFKGTVTISNGEHHAPTIREISKHYCWDCRERLREHGVAPSETIVMAPEQLPTGERCGKCGGGLVPVFRGGTQAFVCSVCGSQLVKSKPARPR